MAMGTTEPDIGVSGDTISIKSSGFGRYHYIFTGWNTEPDGSGTAYAEGDAFTFVDSDVTLYAQWEEREPEDNSPFTFFRLINELPRTGIRGPIGEKPLSIEYKPVQMELSIPVLNVNSEIVTVNLRDGDYPVDWLGMYAGLLEGTALPGQGFSIIAAHNTLDAEQYGPFALISSLDEGDVVFVNDLQKDQLLRFTVYANELIDPDGFDIVETIARQEKNSLVLMTCENEKISGGYLNRRVIFAKP